MTKLVHKLAQHALETHPNQSTSVLERLPEDEVVQVLDAASLESAAAILERLSPQLASRVLCGLRPERAARVLEALTVDSAARLVRRVDENRQLLILELVDERRAQSLRRILRFREGSAGALMDPDVLALPSDLTARESLQRVRKEPELARYNVYVVSENQKLVGAVNLRELLLAPGRRPLVDLMVRDPHRVLAGDDRASVLAHPGWKEVHSLPVVDGEGAFLGAIRYRVLRRIEEELLAPRSADVEAGAAFGEVIAAGARGLIDAISGVGNVETGRGGHGANEGS